MLDRERYRKREREKRDDLRRDWMLTWRRQLRHHSPASSLSFSAKLFSSLSLSLSFYGFQEMIGKKFINDSFLKAEIKSSAEKNKKEKEKSIRSAPTKTKAETPVKNGGCRSPEKRRADK